MACDNPRVGHTKPIRKSDRSLHPLPDNKKPTNYLVKKQDRPFQAVDPSPGYGYNATRQNVTLGNIDVKDNPDMEHLVSGSSYRVTHMPIQRTEEEISDLWDYNQMMGRNRCSGYLFREDKMEIQKSNKLLEKGKLNVGFIDGSWGSSGKGKFNGLLALKEAPDFAVSQNSVNASHVIVWDDGREYKFAHLPSSTINPSTDIVMGAGASIQLNQMIKEIEDWNLTPERLFIHPNAVVITPEDIEYEKEHLVRIASTMTGNGAAAGRKVMRHPNCKFAIDFPELKPFVRDTTTLINNWLKGGKTGILETAQGFELSMDHGVLYEDKDNDGYLRVNRAYPYTTSRNVDPSSFAGMTGVAPRMLGNTLLNLRAFPIRVGDGSNNKIDGYSGVDLTGSSSGPIWPDQMEMTWEEITQVSGSDTPISEMTSLTKRLRRVFSFSTMQLQHITKVVQPKLISVNFVNYIDANSFGVKGNYTKKRLAMVFPAIAKLVSRIECEQYWAGTPYAAKVVWLGTGPQESQYIEITGD
jgi:hypothetical protein